MRIKIKNREENSNIWKFLSPIVALVLSLLAGMILFYFWGYPIIDSFVAFYLKPFSNIYNIGEIALKAIPLILIALGLSLGFKAGIWNIGGEGQFIIGALGAASVSLYFIEQQGFWILPLAGISAMFVGMLWAFLPALFYVKFNVNIVLSSLMLNYIASLLLVYLVHGILKDPDGFNFPESKLFSESTLLSPLIENTRLHSGVFFIFLFSFLTWYVLKKTYLGFKMQVVGFSTSTANYAGISSSKIVWISMGYGGLLAGLAGMMEVNGAIGQINATFSTGYGYTAIIVAFLGRLNPIGIFFAGILLATSYIGGEIAQLELGFPSAVIGVFQGMLLFFLLVCDFFYEHKITILK